MPTRYLKPGICDSESIDKCSPIAETLFYRLLVNVDDYGRLDARPAVVRSKCFPLKDSLNNNDVLNLLKELQEAGLILIYKSNDCAYIQMLKWDNVPRSKESKCPAFDNDCIQMYTEVCKQHTNLPVTVTVTGTETVNRKPDTKENIKENKKEILSLIQTMLPDIDPQVVSDFEKHRRNKKAAITKTALNGIRREATKAGITLEAALIECCERGWVGFKADWYNKTDSPPQKQRKFNASELMQGHGDGYGNPLPRKENGIIDIN